MTRATTIQIGAPTRPQAPIGRPAAILRELASHDAQTSFQGLRRRLHIHQQTLSRNLDRLVADGQVETIEGQYQLTPDGRDAPAARQATQATFQELARTALPAGDLAALVAALEGRWFEGLHWYGRSDGPGEAQLIWITANGRLLRLRLIGATAIVEIEGNPIPADAALALRVLAALAAQV